MSPPSHGPWTLTAISLGFLTTTATAAACLLLVSAQLVAQRPAREGVLLLHLGRAGELRLWNQPLRPQDLPLVMERIRRQSGTSRPLVVRLAPDGDVPWGMVHGLLSRLGPATPRDPWTLQLQLP
ncbi:MAG: hypothetical protein VKP70_12235 [Cyanobacteriota bacterium]|nr:hypothetical protein [Cyanobacteriota bacterium]